MIDYGKLDAIAQEAMVRRKAHALRERGYIYRHGKRVAKGVITLRQSQTQDDSHDDALRIAAMFHDVGKGVEPHNRTGALVARELLTPVLEPALLDEVIHLIGRHTNRESTDLWENLLQDADLLDHFGSLDVGLAFQYSAYTEAGFPETLAWFRDPQGLKDTAPRCRTLLHFDYARAIYDDRVAFAFAFADRFDLELAGEYAIPIPSGTENRAE